MNEKIVELVLSYVQKAGGIDVVERLNNVLKNSMTDSQVCKKYIQAIADHESDSPAQGICSAAMIGLALASLIYRKEKKEIVFDSRREGTG